VVVSVLAGRTTRVVKTTVEPVRNGAAVAVGGLEKIAPFRGERSR
jgi:hypothetical protein